MPIHRILAVLLLLTLSLQAPAQAEPVQTWDGLPALDPLHLHGPHAGERVCPMCRYGYDAGVLAILPTDTTVDSIAAVAGRLVELPVEPVDAPRFRRFLLFAGAPAADQLAAAAVPGLQVAQLDGDALSAAEGALGRTLSAPWAFVFAQRRLLLQFDPLQPPATLGAHARHAQRFLHEHFPEPVHSEDPDLPRGRLWLAPNRLHEFVRLGGEPSQRELCLSDDSGLALAGSLVEVAVKGSARLHWARADAQGCVALRGQTPSEMRLRAFVALRNTVELSVTAAQWRTAEVLNLRAATPHALSGTAVLGPCEGCALALLGLPEHAPVTARLAPVAMDGERLRIEGQVRDAAGKPASDVWVYAYQTDVVGQYPQPAWLSPHLRPHGSLRAWARTDAEGRYAFDTVRPGAYPDQTEPQHVHMHLIEPGRCTYYLDDLVFDDDPLLIGRHRRDADLARGGSGISRPHWDGGRWWVRRDLQLGLNVDQAGNCDGTDRSEPVKSQTP